MLKCLHFVPTRRRVPSRSGWTLVEVMVAMVAGTIILGSMIEISMFVRQAFVAVSGYSDMNRYSRNSLDTLSKDIRSSKAVVYHATNYITISNLDNTTISYKWDPTTTVLTRSNVDGIRLMLTNCDFLCISNYQRHPNSGFSFYPAGTNQTKLVDVSWHCARSMLGSKLFTESVQTAKIVIRN